jgi:NADH dehydrogenase
MKTHRLVVVGGGIAGLDVATHLAGKRTSRGALEVTLIDREPAHVWKPMLHTIAAGTRELSEQQAAYLAQAHRSGFAYELGEATAVDRASRLVRLAPLKLRSGEGLVPPREIPYDTLILSVGSQANDFGTPGVLEHCKRLDSRAEAVAFNEEVRLRVFRCLAKSRKLRIGIVGGGATGVELAAELVALAQIASSYGIRRLPDLIRIVLLDRGKRLLTAFPERISAAARQRLESLGIEIRLNAHVAGADEEGFRLEDGSLVGCELKVWAAGVKAADVLKGIDGLEKTSGGQLVINPNLQATRDRDIFALGDCASLTLPGQDRPLPPTAQVASQQARFMIRNLPRMLRGDVTPSFKYHDFGSLVSLGGFDAFGSLGQFGFFDGFIRGRAAQIGHALLYREHQVRLNGWLRGSLLWLADTLNRQVKPGMRMD